MKVLNLLHHKEIAKEFKFIEDGKEVDVSEFPLDKKTTVIVGANNSRKSRFLRYLLMENSYLETDININSYFEKLNYVIKEIPEGIFINLGRAISGEPLSTNNDYPELEDLLKIDEKHPSNRPEFEVKKQDFQNLLDDFNNLIKNKTDKVKEFKHQLILLKSSFDIALKAKKAKKAGVYLNFYVDGVAMEDVDGRKIAMIFLVLKCFSDSLFDLISPKRTYIPTLRGTLQLIQKTQDKEESISNKCFELTTAKNYGLEEDIEIFTGLDLYQEIKSARNSKRTIREGFEKFEEFLANNFFGGKTIDIIALEDEPGQIQVYIEGDSDRKIYDLGDGIQSLIILLYPIFNATEGEWIFIEEPELNMHPGLQSLFLNTITTNKFIKEKKLQLFITSHSNHFLNCLIEQENLVNIFSFEQITGGKDGYSIIRQVSNSTTQVLNLIGVKNSSVFMSNCSIWVEGISDRKILKAMLQAYCEQNDYPKFIEGYHYAFFEYAGSNLVHYLFSEEDVKETEKIKAHFIANKIFLLADTDGKSDKAKLKRHQELEKLSRDDFVYMQTGAVEIENILGASVIKKIIKDFWKDADLSKIEIDESEYEDVRLGKYLIEKLDGNMLKVPMLKKDSGTLKTYYKNKISEFIINSVEDDSLKWSDFATNRHAVKIVEKLYEYIKNQN